MTDALVLDIETAGTNPWCGDVVRGIAWCDGTGSGYVNVSHGDRWDVVGPAGIIARANDAGTLVLHNALFDLSFLVPMGLRVDPERLHDTMVFAWLEDENQPLGLKEITGEKDEQSKLKALMRAGCSVCGGHTSRKPKKAEIEKWGYGPIDRVCASCEYPFIEHAPAGTYKTTWRPKRDWGDLTYEEMAPYATRDAELTWSLYWQQVFVSEGVEQDGVTQSAFRREMEILELCLRMTLEGLPILESDVHRQLGACELRASDARKQLSVDPNSPKKLGEYLTERGLDLPLTATGKPSTNHDALLRHQSDPVVAKVLEYRKATKEGQFYAKMLELVGTDGRLHPRWRPTGTVSGRFSCSDPNAQQWPRQGGVRDCIVAPENYTLLSADLSQAELRVAAHYGQCERLIGWFNDGEDVYQNVADELGIERQQAKVVVLSSLYGVGPRKLRTILLRAGIVATPTQARDWLNGWRALVPELGQGMERAERVAIQRGYVRLVQPGRYRHFRGAPAWKAQPRDAWNAVIQGGVAECVKTWMLRCDRAGRGWAPAVTIAAQIHDSLSFFVPTDPNTGGYRRLMEPPSTAWQRMAEDLWHETNPFDVTIPVEWKVGL